MNYKISKKSKLLRGFDKTANLVRDYVVFRYGEELAGTLISEARKELETTIIPHIPDIRGLPALNFFLEIAALELSVYRTMKKHGKSESEAWKICHEALKVRTQNMPRILKKFIQWYLFTNFVKNRARKMSGKDLGGFSFEYVEKDGDWGVNYTRCAIYEFLKTLDGEEFAPYVCLSDMVLSDAMGWGLKRTTTLADGCDRCDFRFRKGAKTEISSKLPGVQSIIEKISGMENYQSN